MVWLKLTHRDGTKCLINSDQVSEIYGCPGPVRSTGAMRMGDSVVPVEETVDEIAAMIETAEWRERALKVACAIITNEHAAGLRSEHVWSRAVHFAAMHPERPQGS